MRIVLDDSKNPGKWRIAVEPTRNSEDMPTPAKLALIFTVLARDCISQTILDEQPGVPGTRGPEIWLPGDPI